jgi:hypothetical protein
MHSWLRSRLIPSVELALSAEMGKLFVMQRELLEVPSFAIRERCRF